MELQSAFFLGYGSNKKDYVLTLKESNLCEYGYAFS